MEARERREWSEKDEGKKRYSENIQAVGETIFVVFSCSSFLFMFDVSVNFACASWFCVYWFWGSIFVMAYLLCMMI